ncbi:MAG: hypothetical protein HUJ68_03000, partial [Clostridia bacterium]|nr:hypothetical protein [Clostridia bacterium]
MPKIGNNFIYESKNPNFKRDVFISFEEMRLFNDNFIDHGHISFCLEDNHHYSYRGNDIEHGGCEFDEKTGYWRLTPIDLDDWNFLKYKGSVDTYEDLPTESIEGDVYKVEDTAIFFFWTISGDDNAGYWEKLEPKIIIEIALI